MRDQWVRFESYRYAYAEMLYRWGFLSKRAEIMKHTLKRDPRVAMGPGDILSVAVAQNLLNPCRILFHLQELRHVSVRKDMYPMPKTWLAMLDLPPCAERYDCMVYREKKDRH